MARHRSDMIDLTGDDTSDTVSEVLNSNTNEKGIAHI